MTLLFFVFMLWLMAVLVIGPYFMGQQHRKEKAEKVALMREFPHMAPELMQSIEEQDARFRDTVGKHLDSVGEVFKPKRRKSPAGKAMAKLGISVARRLLK